MVADCVLRSLSDVRVNRVLNVFVLHCLLIVSSSLCSCTSRVRVDAKIRVRFPNYCNIYARENNEQLSLITGYVTPTESGLNF